jgi:hypothetical protein
LSASQALPVNLSGHGESLSTFLIIEDNAQNAILVGRVFQELGTSAAFVCRNNSEAKAYLRGAGMYADRNEFPFPNAVICDLRCGEESGIEFLTGSDRLMKITKPSRFSSWKTSIRPTKSPPRRNMHSPKSYKSLPPKSISTPFWLISLQSSALKTP